MSAAATYRKLARIRRARDDQQRVTLIATKGRRTITTRVYPEVAEVQAKVWAAGGYTVTIEQGATQ